MMTPQIQASTHPSENQATFMGKLQQLDLDPIAYQLVYSHESVGWTHEQVRQAIAAYKQFLFLIYCYPNQSLVPTDAIDRVWHHHILDTQKYAEDCQFLFNRFIHHFPYYGVRSESDRQAWRGSVAETQALFQEHFGVESQLKGPSNQSDPSDQFVDCQPLSEASDLLRPSYQRLRGAALQT